MTKRHCKPNLKDYSEQKQYKRIFHHTFSHPMKEPRMTPVHTLDDLLQIYTAQYLTNNAPRTQYQQQRLFHRFSHDLGALPVESLTPAVLRQYRDQLRQTLKPGTVRQYLDSLSAVLTVAVEELEWLTVHPLRKVRKPPASPGRVRVLSEAERVRLLQACAASRNPGLYPLVLLALTTGARRGEILSLRWQDGDLERGILRLAQTKNRERRPVPVPAVSLERLRTWSTGQPLSAWVVPRLSAKTVFPGEHAWRAALQRAEVTDFRFHDLRHTFASYLAMSGATLAEIAEVLGHKTLTMVRRYVHFTAPHTHGIVERMAEKFLAG
jgi:integrase